VLSEFLQDLFAHGRVRVSAPGGSTDADLVAAADVLRRAEETRRQSLPSNPPEFLPDVGLWAADRVYNAAQFLVFRDADPKIIQQSLKRREPAPTTSSEHYSGDLCLYFMKDILRLSTAASENDPLNDMIRALMTDWPLSAVSLECAAVPGPNVMEHKALRLMYLDRVVKHNDRQALQHDVVKNALQDAVGIHRNLLPIGLRGTAPACA
jgi:hypothetical protein